MTITAQVKNPLVAKFLRDESGATAIEYGLLAAMVASAGVFGLQDVGRSLSNFMSFTSGKLDEAM